MSLLRSNNLSDPGKRLPVIHTAMNLLAVSPTKFASGTYVQLSIIKKNEHCSFSNYLFSCGNSDESGLEFVKLRSFVE